MDCFGIDAGAPAVKPLPARQSGEGSSATGRAYPSECAPANWRHSFAAALARGVGAGREQCPALDLGPAAGTRRRP